MPTPPGSLIRRLTIVASVLVLSAACGDSESTSSGSSATTEPMTTVESIGCGLADETLVTDAIGTDVTSTGTGRLIGAAAKASVMTCDVNAVDEPGRFLTIRVSYPPASKLAQLKAQLMSGPARGCRHAWISADHLAGSCRRSLQHGSGTFVTSIWGSAQVNIVLARPKPRADDAKTVYGIARDVSAHLD
jgi:hypothetical protein